MFDVTAEMMMEEVVVAEVELDDELDDELEFVGMTDEDPDAAGN